MRVCGNIAELNQIESDIYIYGSGFRAKTLYHFLNKKHKKITGFVTTKKESKTMQYHIPVECIWDKMYDENLVQAVFIIAVQEKYWDEIVKLLRVMNVPDEQIICLDYNKVVEQDGEIETMLQSQKVYGAIRDDLSRLIYCQGVKYRLTNDYKYFMSCIGTMDREAGFLKSESGNFWQWIKVGNYKRTDKKIVLYVPNRFWIEFSYLRLKEMGINIDCMCSDNDGLCNQLIYNVPVIGLKRAAEFIGDGYLIIGTGREQFTKTVEQKIYDSGFCKENIVLPCSGATLFNFGCQYFSLDELKPIEDEVFVDAGCLNCGTDLDFIEWNEGVYKHIYAFEPDKVMYKHCLNVVDTKEIKKITVVNKGLWNETKEVHFAHNGNTSLSKIQDNGKDIIETITLDEFLAGEKVTFIKMDIEGAEMETLEGAAETIKKYKPRMAISLYHKVNDFIDIPEYILSLVPEYKFYVRHYSCYKFETILYAII